MEATKLGTHIRNEFPLFENNKKIEDGQIKPFSYLDSAVSAQKHISVIEAMMHHLAYDYGSVHRGAYSVSVRSSQMYENTRSIVANFIGKSVQPEQIVYTRGATESLNILANGIAEEYLNENSRIVIPAAEHHANLIPWQQVALKKNCELAYIPFEGKKGKELRLDLSETKKLITPNTKVVSLAHVGNVIGQINPIQEVIALAKSVGALVVLDCAQSMTCIEEDVFALGADAIAFSPHKIYGPSGLGILAMSKELIERLPPFTYGGAMIADVTLEGSYWAEGPAKFEAGTPPITEVAGLGAAIHWITKVGKKNIHDHAAGLASEFLSKIQELPDIEVFAPGTGQETILSFRHKRIHAHDLATILDTENIAMRAGHHCAWPLIRFLEVDALVRCSFAAYSDKDDIELALAAIKKASKIA